MRSIINFIVNEFIYELEYQKKLKYNSIKELEKNDKQSTKYDFFNKRTIDELSSEIEDLEMKIDIYKELFLKDYSG